MVANFLNVFVPAVSRLVSLSTIEVLLLVCFGFLHGSRRYGLKGMIVFFVITWVVSNSLESLSIATGFPFGEYYSTGCPARGSRTCRC